MKKNENSLSIYKLRYRLLLFLIIIIAIPVIGQKNISTEPLVPVIDGDWWQVSGDPDLGVLYTTEKQQPVDFAIWQAADGTWQILSCIRGTNCGGRTRLLYQWQGKSITDSDWHPIGITMEADTNFGETFGCLQAPHVIKIGNEYHNFYGDGANICLAKGMDGKTFARQLQPNGKSGMF